MLFLLSLAFALFSWRLQSPPPAAGSCDTTPLLIRNTSVWTPAGVLPSRDVLLREGRVARISAARSRPHEGVRVLDGTGHTLLPGLVDAHLHFVIPGGLPPTEPPRTSASEIAGRQLLRSGVTSGRVHLASLEDAPRLQAGSRLACAPLPWVQVGGPGISGAATRDFPIFWGAQTVADVLEKVERERAAGVDWIAVHDADRFPSGVLPALASAARKSGIRLMASATTPAELDAALAVRPDTLDYLDGSPASSYSGDALDRIRSQRQLVLVPTAGVAFRTDAYARQPALLDADANFEFLRPPDRVHVHAAARKALEGPELTRARRLLASMPEKLRQLRSLGLPVALGSDAGSTLHFQSGAIWWELEAWRALGASHREALAAATEGAARVLGLSDVGRLQPGSRADFVLYRGDAESGAFDLARVIAVGKGGALFVSNGSWLTP